MSFVPANDLPLVLIPLAVDQKSNHKYSKLFNIPILNTVHSKVYIPKSTIFGTLQPVEIENAAIGETHGKKWEFK